MTSNFLPIFTILIKNKPNLVFWTLREYGESAEGAIKQ